MKTRQNPRKAINLPGRYLTDLGEPQDVILRDLSPGGCRFESGGWHFTLGAPIQIFVGGTGPHRATVKWIAKGEVGLTFAVPLTKEQVSQFQSTHVPDSSQSNIGVRFDDTANVMPQRFC